jgi:hypothetical protein
MTDDSPEKPEKPEKPRRTQQVYTLLVEVGRAPGDGLPDRATGAGLLCYATGVDEAEAVRETVALLKTDRDAPGLPRAALAAAFRPRLIRAFGGFERV